MSNTIYLYIKTHNKTGLKYLGKTIQNPYKYKGSGIRWVNHIKKHGYDVSTEIIYQSENAEEIKQKGIEYSIKFNIKENKEFANLKIEEGDGGWDHINSNPDLKREAINKSILKCKKPPKKKVYKNVSGSNNSQYNKPWYINPKAKHYTERTKEYKEGYILLTEWTENKKRKNKGSYGRRWYNDGTNNYFLKPEDNIVGLNKGRLKAFA